MTNPYAAPHATVTDVHDDETYEPRMFSTQGRIGRLRYLAYSFVTSFVTVFVFAFVGGMLMALLNRGNAAAGNSMLVVIGIAYIPMIVIYAIMMKRRLNDLNHSGWLGLLALVPLVNLLFGLYLTFWPGSKGSNDYGPAPGKNSTLLVVFGLIVPIVFIGILAAVAIPAYQGYVTKARLHQQLQQEQSAYPAP
jgi:uncharacterized membrane protein YhaH (DUF805 family)